LSSSLLKQPLKKRLFDRKRFQFELQERAKRFAEARQLANR